MNQYEIELRDKYFEKAWDELAVDFRVERERREWEEDEGGEYLRPLLPPEIRLEQANDFADKCMAERQKHLDKAEMVEAQMAGADAKVQGTECDR